jgi:peroxiredoxin
MGITLKLLQFELKSANHRCQRKGLLAMKRRYFTVAAASLSTSIWANAPEKKRPMPIASVPAMSGTTLQGQPYTLKMDQGKVVMVFFWATTCAVCRDKMAELRKNAQGWRGKGFQLVLVSLDKKLNPLHDYQNAMDATLSKDQRLPSLWRLDAAHTDNFGTIEQTPTTFVLDRQHRIIKTIQGRIDPTLWDDVAELVLA